MQNQNNNQEGYTIIETMIAVSLFLIIVMAGMGALLNANLLHQKSQSMRSIMDNLSFVMEDIGRNLRTGYHYQCFSAGDTLLPSALGAPKSCASGWALAFESASGSEAIYADQWIYYLSDTGKIFKSTDGANNYVQLTPDEVVIDATVSNFSVLGAEPPPDTQQPFATIKLTGKITFKNTITPFSLQTSVSQRLIDI